MNPVKKQDCQKENFDRRRRKYYKPGDKVWVTIHPISRNTRSRKFMPKREGPYLILTLRSPVTYEIADPANPDQALGTYHVSALKDYQEPETERNTEFVAPLRKRRCPKKELSPGSTEPEGESNVLCTCEYESIINYSPSLNSLMIVTGTGRKGSKYIFSTNQATQIAHLIKDYTNVIAIKRKPVEVARRRRTQELHDGTTQKTHRPVSILYKPPPPLANNEPV
ncbi:pleckstrin y domain-containing family H member 1 [Trichonephila clavipes]|nr:pleckstrin y domain-containing family H member 1 [Trichonephila clavipes]